MFSLRIGQDTRVRLVKFVLVEKSKMDSPSHKCMPPYEPNIGPFSPNLQIEFIALLDSNNRSRLFKVSINGEEFALEVVKSARKCAGNEN